MLTWWVTATADRLWDRVRKRKLHGVPLTDVVGGGDPKIVALATIRQIDREVGFRPGMSVLDLGCGWGRIAVGLRPHIGWRGRYIGIDIVPGLIAFAKRHISLAFWGFRFVLRDGANQSYDWYIGPRRWRGIRAVRDVCPDGSIDLVIAISLFTHLTYGEAQDLLKEVAAALKPGGQAFLTFFILDDEAKASVQEGHSAFRFSFESPDGRAFIEKEDVPSHAVAFTRPGLETLFREAGLEIDRTIRGSWSGRTAEGLQDVVILRHGRSFAAS